MKKVLWFLVVLKNEKPSDGNKLMVGKGGFEHPSPDFFQHNFNRLATLPCKLCGSLWFADHR
jgi:hypothetical protein